VILQVAMGMILPLLLLSVVRSKRLNEDMRKLLYFTSVLLVELGIFSMRWNVVIGGQLFSKSFRGLMAYKMEITGIESLASAVVLLSAPFIVLTILLKVLPPDYMDKEAAQAS